MLNIWFSENNDEKPDFSSNHESFFHHLLQESEDEELMIFSAFGDDSKITEGFKTLKSHFHSSCRYRGPLRSINDKFIAQACYEFLNLKHVLPVMISDDSQYKNILQSTEDGTNPLKSVFINNKIEAYMLQQEGDLSSTGFLAVQKHYTNQQHWVKCADESYNFLRLGKLKNQLDVGESIIRDADFIEFDISAIKHGELSSNKKAPITGLNIEEACLLMKYVGASNNLQFLNISGYSSESDIDGKIGECISMLLWYFIEGLESRTEIKEKLNKSEFQEYLVQPNHLSIELKFFKHKITGQWWVKLPEEINEGEVVLACSERDYYQACNDEVSERLMQAMSVM